MTPDLGAALLVMMARRLPLTLRHLLPTSIVFLNWEDFSLWSASIFCSIWKSSIRSGHPSNRGLISAAAASPLLLPPSSSFPFVFLGTPPVSWPPLSCFAPVVSVPDSRARSLPGSETLDDEVDNSSKNGCKANVQKRSGTYATWTSPGTFLRHFKGKNKNKVKWEIHTYQVLKRFWG